jgi:hypothetical protein
MNKKVIYFKKKHVLKINRIFLYIQIINFWLILIEEINLFWMKSNKKKYRMTGLFIEAIDSMVLSRFFKYKHVLNNKKIILKFFF